MSKQFAEFLVGDLFILESTSSGIDGNKLNSTEGDVPYVTRSINENGIKQYVTEEQLPGKKLDKGNVITIGLDTQTAYYQPVPFFTGQNVHILDHEKMSRRLSMYLIPQLVKIMQKYSWGGNGATLGRLRNDTITLPITDESAGTESPEPDWEYMETYIKEIEAKYLDSVVKYNKRNGEILDTLYPDYNGSAPEAYDYAEFRVGDVFEVVTGSMVKNLKEGTIPRINPTEQNNGIGSWIEDNNPLARYFEDFVSVSFLGNVFYQGQRSSLEMKVHGLKRKDGVFGHRKGTYVATSVSKAISGVYNYGMQLSSEKLKSVTITLPVTPSGEPDWVFMEDYIDYIAGGGRNRIARYVQHKKKTPSSS